VRTVAQSGIKPLTEISDIAICCTLKRVPETSNKLQLARRARSNHRCQIKMIRYDFQSHELPIRTLKHIHDLLLGSGGNINVK